MDQEIFKKFEEQDRKLNMILESAERSRKYFLMTFIFNIIVFVLPLIGLIIIIPWFLKTVDYSSLGL